MMCSVAALANAPVEDLSARFIRFELEFRRIVQSLVVNNLATTAD